MTTWQQNYHPLGSVLLSTAMAALPLVVLLVSLALLRIRVHIAALLGLGVALLLALRVYAMPEDAVVATAIYGAAFGLFPIGWTVLNIIFLYQLTLKRGYIDVLRDSLAAVAADARIQLLLIAFAFGALLEGMAGLGAPVAITAAILIQLGFTPLPAPGLAMIANTAPVAFGSLGVPLTTLEHVTGIDARLLAAMAGRQLFLFSVLIPFWIVAVFAGWRGMPGVWAAALTAGLAFAIPQLLISSFHGPWLAAIGGGACSIAALMCLTRFWQPKAVWKCLLSTDHTVSMYPVKHARKSVIQAWIPWAILTLSILCWSLPQTKAVLDHLGAIQFSVPHLDQVVQRVPPVAPLGTKPEAAVFKLHFFSATGTGILIVALLSGLILRFSVREMLRTYVQTLWRVRYSLVTIAAMFSLGTVTRYSGADGTLGLALAGTGALYPFFGAILGWLGVALTGSDTARLPQSSSV